MRKAIVAAICLVALAGCKDYGRCLESHVMLMPIVHSVGKTTFVTLMPMTICDRYEFPEGR